MKHLCDPYYSEDNFGPGPLVNIKYDAHSQLVLQFSLILLIVSGV